MMNRKELRQAQKQLERLNKQFTDEFVEIPKTEWPCDFNPDRSRRIKVYRNKFFLVQIFIEDGKKIRISINRSELGNDGQWKDNISWDELQKIKRSIGFGNQMAVEIYPRDEDIINVANMRHLWIIDNGTDLGWGNKNSL